MQSIIPLATFHLPHKISIYQSTLKVLRSTNRRCSQIGPNRSLPLSHTFTLYKACTHGLLVTHHTALCIKYLHTHICMCVRLEVSLVNKSTAYNPTNDVSHFAPIICAFSRHKHVAAAYRFDAMVKEVWFCNLWRCRGKRWKLGQTERSALFDASYTACVYANVCVWWCSPLICYYSSSGFATYGVDIINLDL